MLFLSENIFFLVSSHLRHFAGVCEGPIHYAASPWRESDAYGGLCLRVYPQTAIMSFVHFGIHKPVCVGGEGGMGAGKCMRVHICFVCCCLLPVLFSVRLEQGHSPMQKL